MKILAINFVAVMLVTMYVTKCKMTVIMRTMPGTVYSGQDKYSDNYDIACHAYSNDDLHLCGVNEHSDMLTGSYDVRSKSTKYSCRGECGHLNT